MIFERQEDEYILIDGREILSLKCIMKLKGPAYLFWPYEYSYWFRKEDKSFLRYSDPSANKDIEITEIISSSAVR